MSSDRGAGDDPTLNLGNQVIPKASTLGNTRGLNIQADLYRVAGRRALSIGLFCPLTDISSIP
jgi:hypothetical protein